MCANRDTEDSILKSAFQHYPFLEIEESEDFKIYRVNDTAGIGSGTLRCFRVMPGVHLSYDCLDMKSCYQRMSPVHGFLEISHCKEGCFEFELDDGQVCFLGEGDLCVCLHENCYFKSSHLPREHYRGISLVIDIQLAQKTIEHMIPTAEIDLIELERRFQQKGVYMIRARAELEHIFSELYHVDERIRKTYSLIKTVELILFLSLTLEEPQERLPRFLPSTVSQTKQVHQFVSEHPCCKNTCKELAESFYISETSLRTCFKAIYGYPLATYQKIQLMNHAAQLMQTQQECSLSEISEMCGYNNQSKFSAAFKAIQGKTPRCYRRILFDGLEQNHDTPE